MRRVGRILANFFIYHFPIALPIQYFKDVPFFDIVIFYKSKANCIASRALTDLSADKSVITLEIIYTEILYVKGLKEQSTRIENIEDWRKYGFDGEIVYPGHDKYAIEKHKANISLGKIGEKELKLWQDKRPTGRWTEFVLNGKFLIVKNGVSRFRVAIPGLAHAAWVDEVTPLGVQKDFSRYDGLRGHFPPNVLIPQGPAVGVPEKAHPEPQALIEHF